MAIASSSCSESVCTLRYPFSNLGLELHWKRKWIVKMKWKVKRSHQTNKIPLELPQAGLLENVTWKRLVFHLPVLCLPMRAQTKIVLDYWWYLCRGTDGRNFDGPMVSRLFFIVWVDSIVHQPYHIPQQRFLSNIGSEGRYYERREEHAYAQFCNLYGFNLWFCWYSTWEVDLFLSCTVRKIMWLGLL